MKLQALMSLAAGALIFASCNNNSGGMTENEMNARVDSLVGAQMESLQQEAMNDLDRRMAIEVKAKADSIVAAVRNQ